MLTDCTFMDGSDDDANANFPKEASSSSSYTISGTELVEVHHQDDNRNKTKSKFNGKRNLKILKIKLFFINSECFI